MTAGTLDQVQPLTFTGWAERPGRRCAPLEGETTCDVVVVGGGLLGMATALRLVERGVDVVVLEGEFLGWGSASRNAGYLTNTVAGDPQVLALAFPRLLPRLVEMADHAVDEVESLIERFDIACDYERSGNVLTALSPGQVRRARRSAELLQKAGAAAEYVDGREFGLPRHALGAIFEKRGGLLNPALLAAGLRDAVIAAGVRVHEGTPVGEVRAEGTGVVAVSPGGRVRAARALLATNAFSRDLDATPRNLSVPLWVSMVETEPIDPARVEATGWTNPVGMSTMHTILENYRRTPRDTIVFGIRRPVPGRGALATREPDPRVVADQVRGFGERFPELAGVRPARTWGGWIAMTPSWLPVAGHAGDGIHYALPCNGHGLAMAPYVGRYLADVLAGDPVPEQIEPLWRSRPRFLPSPVFTGPGLGAAWALDRWGDRRRRT